MEEIWKDIEGYEGWYQVSNLGNVKRLKKVHWNHGKKNIVVREHILKPTEDKKGYLLCCITNGNQKRHCKVHRLVAEAFIKNPFNCPQVDHINRNKKDNRAINLRWVTNIENQRNTDHTVQYYIDDKVEYLSDLCKKYGMKEGTVYMRLRRGWDIKEALTTPPISKFNWRLKNG